MRYRVPSDAREELGRLAEDDQTPQNAWRLGCTDTEFRRQMLPHNDHDDPDFRIIVPVSGGLDSATCYQMALIAGLPVVPVMVETGVPYVVHDMQAAKLLTSGTLETLTLPEGEWHSIGDFQVGRNSVIVWQAAEWAHHQGWWGEVWLGNLGGNYLETPMVGGDKSFRWAATMQHMITLSGYDFRITSPLGGMSKADCVTWWDGRDMMQAALHATRSCFADLPGQCGRCWACLYRYVAFAARGYGPELLATYVDGIDFTEPAREFWRRTEWDVVTTSPGRLVEVTKVLKKLKLGREQVLGR